ncbi:unnamed protein product [Mesocestoides corti]|uniref:Secreted protein n=1 Tax=Mesocestoides corti TaxID=53468 RepID=A0A0R3U2U6_MESCO|nr:unnamed protein product [Mesocestoides corti]
MARSISTKTFLNKWAALFVVPSTINLVPKSHTTSGDEPNSNERLPPSIKSHGRTSSLTIPLTAHSNSSRWTDVLPLVLLGLRSTAITLLNIPTVMVESMQLHRLFMEDNEQAEI